MVVPVPRVDTGDILVIVSEAAGRPVLVAPAKLTLSLRVVGVRDDGYHLIDAEMVSLDLADTLTIGSGTGVTYHRGGGGDSIDLGEGDLVSTALARVGRRVAVEVTKRIPAGAGLGGGSSDAAAILRWAGVTDTELAAGIGADVAFCLVGGRARVGGIGELVQPLPPIDEAYTLLTPPLHVSTPVVYRRWDELGGPRARGDNDLEPAALDAYPELRGWRDLLGEATGLTPVLAGSGGTWFVPGEYDLTLGGVATVVAHTVGPQATGTPTRGSR